MPIPNLENNPAFDAQAAPDASDWQNVANAIGVTGIVSGCVVSAGVITDMIVQSTAGSVFVNGTIHAVAAASVTIANASASDRRDMIVANASGSVFAVQGTPCGTPLWTRNSFPALPPVKAAIPANCVFLSDIYVASSTTNIQSSNINNNTTVITLNPAAGVSSFNTRTGAVTFTAADIGSTFTAAGQIPTATGSGTGTNLPIGSSGFVLTSNGASVSWQPASGGTASVNSTTIEATFTQPGQIYVGTGLHTGALLAAGSVSTVLVSNGAASVPTWQPATNGGNMNTSVYDPAAGAKQVAFTVGPQVVSNTTITRRWAQASSPGASVSVVGTSFDGGTYSALSANITSIVISGANVIGQLFEFVFIDNGTPRNITWPAAFAATSVALPTGTVASQPLHVLFQYNGSTTWYCLATA